VSSQKYRMDIITGCRLFFVYSKYLDISCWGH